MLTGLYAKLIGAGLIVAACLGAWWYVNNLQGTIKQLEKDLIVCVEQGKVLAATIEEQNASVLKNKEEADKRVEAAQKLVDAAKAETAKAQQKARDIYKRPPSTPGTSCEADRQSTLDLLNGGAK